MILNNYQYETDEDISDEINDEHDMNRTTKIRKISKAFIDKKCKSAIEKYEYSELLYILSKYKCHLSNDAFLWLFDMPNYKITFDCLDNLFSLMINDLSQEIIDETIKKSIDNDNDAFINWYIFRHYNFDCRKFFKYATERNKIAIANKLYQHMNHSIVHPYNGDFRQIECSCDDRI
jgi:hypothetical protein